LVPFECGCFFFGGSVFGLGRCSVREDDQGRRGFDFGTAVPFLPVVVEVPTPGAALKNDVDGQPGNDGYDDEPKD
jgi:hypothetical protein